MKLTLIISQDAEMFFSIRTSFIHLKKSPTAHSIFYKESVIDNTQPDYVKDKLEMPPIATESSEDLPTVLPMRINTASEKSWSNQTEKSA